MIDEARRASLELAIDDEAVIQLEPVLTNVLV